SGMPSPVLWGDEATVRDRLKDGISDLKLASSFYTFDYPFPPDAVVDFYRENYGPTSRAFASLDAQGQKELRNELAALWSSHNKATDGTTKVEAQYLEVVATRGAEHGHTEARSNVSRRAATLADRIEEGAAGLASFAEGLSEVEWLAPVTPGSDERPIGVIVYHVAAVYPIEI